MLSHMKKLGFNPKVSDFKPFDQAQKINWLWNKLEEAGGLRDGSPESLLAFIARTTGTSYSNIKFLSTADSSKIIEALKSMLGRAKRSHEDDQ